MGINKFYKLLGQYYTEVLSSGIPKFKSEICYIDCTSRIYNLFYKHYKLENLKSRITNDTNVYQVIETIIENVANNLVTLILENKHYKKYVLVFDYKFTSPLNEHFKFSDEIVKFFEGGFDTMNKLDVYEKMNSKVMIPKHINIVTTPLNELKLLIRNSGEIKWTRWNPAKNIVNYVSVDWLLNNIKQDFRLKYKSPIDCEIQKYPNPNRINDIELRNEIIKYKKLLELKRFGFYRYLLEHGIKLFANQKQRPKSTEVLKKIWNNSNTDEEFNSALNDYYFEIQPQMIVDLIPHITYKILEKINGSDKEVEFLGCEQESDFVIKKHIKLNCPYGQTPTILTGDTDLLLLLHDVDCVIKMKLKLDKINDNKNRSSPITDDVNLNSSLEIEDTNQINRQSSPKSPILLNANSYTRKQKHNDDKTILYINPKLFWEWLLQTSEYTYQDLITICCKLGTSYNCYHTKFQIETLSEIRTLINNNTQNNLFDRTSCLIKAELNNVYKRSIKKMKTNNDRNLFGLFQILSAMELYKQVDYIENEFHYIKPERMLNRNKIQIRYLNIFSILLFKNDTKQIDLNESPDTMDITDANE